MPKSTKPKTFIEFLTTLNWRFARTAEPVHVDRKPGRNEACPCKSGKKFKQCCGK
jgi:uncharacterized protein YecA (UPF0149 family)